MKANCLTAIILGVCMPAALAQVTVSVAGDTPATSEQIQRLFAIMEVREQTHRMMNSMVQQMQAMSEATIKARYPQITGAELAKLDRISEEVLKEMPLDAMLDDMIPVYQKYLNQADVDAMIVFYQSPTGKKLIAEMPQITQEAMQVSYRHMEKQVDAVMQKVEDMVKEGQQGGTDQKGHAQPTTPPPSSQNPQ
ncbi:MAG TPA: DUF2059 domain-containing protein [Terriglobales bacterium]|nr:DUF2059 domain-containing protein [Terriglobales bacterium]